MAITTTRYYRWDDVGAPVMSGEIGAGLNILRKCLVGDSAGIAYGTGQHAKPAAGWSEPFSDTNVSVFQNSLAHGGSGLMVRVDDRALPGWYGGQHFMRARAYDRDSMTSTADTGTNPTPPPNWRGGTVFQHGIGIRKSNESNSNPKKWIIVADELTCYIWTQMSPNLDYRFLAGLHGFGDADLWDAPPGMNGVIFGSHDSFGYDWLRGYCALHTSAPAQFESPSNANRDDRGQFLAYNRAVTAPAAWSVPALGSTTPASFISTTVPVASIGGEGMPSRTTADVICIPAYIASERHVRGRLRGMYAPMANLLDEMAVHDVVAADRRLVFMRTNNYTRDDQYLGTLAIETQAPW